jgi:hypothetical protein
MLMIARETGERACLKIPPLRGEVAAGTADGGVLPFQDMSLILRLFLNRCHPSDARPRRKWARATSPRRGGIPAHPLPPRVAPVPSRQGTRNPPIEVL